MPDIGVRDALELVTGALSAAEDRPGQRSMAMHVANALESSRHVIVQAGTGTGKTLAYLVPLVLSGRRAVVTTATKALQDQIANNDLPLIARTLGAEIGVDVNWAVLKGRSNYVCRQRLDEVLGRGSKGSASGSASGSAAAPTLPDVDDLGATGRSAVLRIDEWCRRNVSGDVADCPVAVTERVRQAVTVSSDECPGAKRCPHGETCFAEQARAAASVADIVIVNSHLYGLDIGSGGVLLPEHEVLVVDEAHGLEDILSGSVGISFGPGTLRWFAGIFRRVVSDTDLHTRLANAADEWKRVLLPHAGRRVAGATGELLSSSIREAANNSLLLINECLDVLRGIATSDEDGNQRKLRATTAGGRLVDTLGTMNGLKSDWVAFVPDNAENPVLEIAPLDIGRELNKRDFWNTRTTVLTSATVPANLSARVGLPDEGFDAEDVGSPFDYETNSLLYVTNTFPNPNDPAFDALVHDELVHLIRAAGGRTLALFTSLQRMRDAAAAVRSRVDVPIIVQGDIQKNLLVEQFADDEATCLFASAGFFQGIDIPGRTLSLVTIDRIPFPRPDDPLLSARREQVGDRAFREIDLPRAATQLAQAAGRLIRHRTDRGVVTVFDPRLATAKYRASILSAMPPMRRTVDRRQVGDFLAEIAR